MEYVPGDCRRMLAGIGSKVFLKMILESVVIGDRACMIYLDFSWTFLTLGFLTYFSIVVSYFINQSTE